MRINHILFTAILLLASFSASMASSPPSSIPQSADISMNGMLLQDSDSIEKLLGTELELISPQNIPHINILNADKNQLLTLFFHPGGIKNNFSEFRVKHVSDFTKEAALHIEEIKEFTSGKLIKLGIKKDKLISILGNNYQETEKNGTVTLRYKLSDFDNSEFLKHYNLPIYYGTYIFQNNRLTAFSFGFEYP